MSDSPRAGWSAGPDTNQWVFFDAAQLRQINGPTGVDQVWVQLTADADPAAVQAAIADALPGSAALTAQQVADLQGVQQADALGFLEPLLLVFAGIAVVVASFLIINTFSILVLQRTRELALLRALGASAAQLRATVIIEALVVGLIGSVLGVLAGWGLAAGLLRISGGGARLALSAPVVISSVALGVVVTGLAALLPANRASRIAPVVAMRGVTVGQQTGRPALSRPDQPPAFGQPLNRLAGLNTRRHPGRTVATAGTLAIGLFVVGLLGVFGASMKATIADRIPDVMGTDFLLIAADTIPDERIAAIERLPEVATVHRQAQAGISIDGLQTTASVIKPNDLGTTVVQQMLEGRPAERANELLVVQSLADQEQWRVGSEVPGVINGSEVSWQIVGIFEYPGGISSADLFTHPDTLLRAGLPEEVNTLGVRLADGVDAAVGKAAVQAELKTLPGVTLLDTIEYNRVAGAQVDLIGNAVYALISMSVLVATLGIINTLGLSVVERTREFGLLRAVGMTRAQVAGLVAREALLLSVLGGAAGLGLGVLGGVALQLAARDQLTALAVPWGQLGIALGVIVVIGVVSALWPAARAARTEVLVAVAA